MTRRWSTISSESQITVPLEVRKRLGLKAGDRVEFVVDAGRTTIRPAGAPENPFLNYVGALPAFSSADQINAWIRGLREEEAEGQWGRRSIPTFSPHCGPENSLLLRWRRSSEMRRARAVIGAPVYAELLAHPKATEAFVSNFISDTGIVLDFELD